MLLFEWRVVRAWVSAAGGVLAALATIYLGVARENPAWKNRGGEIAALGVVGSIAVISAISRPIRIFAIGAYEKNLHKIEVALRGLAWAVHEHTGAVVPVKPLGASAYKIRGWRDGKKHLYRIARERVTDYPVPSDIVWTRGKGVIGQCWATSREQICNTDRLFRSITAATEEEWEQVDPDIRMGMTFSDYCQIKGKYGTVIAVPARDANNQLRGVIALDCPPGYHTILKTQGVVEKVNSAANLIGGWL